MNNLLPYWGQSPQPGCTYYMQKVSYDLLGIVDHRDDSGFVYKLIGPKNTASRIFCTISKVVGKYHSGSREFMYSLVLPTKINT